jgi:hypothetical protein
MTGPRNSVNTGAYCKARQRLPVEGMVRTLTPVHGTAVERSRADRMALSRTEREVGRWHRDLDARYGGAPGLLSVAVEPTSRSRLAAGTLGRSDLLVDRNADRWVHLPVNGTGELRLLASPKHRFVLATY